MDVLLLLPSSSSSLFAAAAVAIVLCLFSWFRLPILQLLTIFLVHAQLLATYTCVKMAWRIHMHIAHTLTMCTKTVTSPCTKTIWTCVVCTKKPHMRFGIRVVAAHTSYIKLLRRFGTLTRRPTIDNRQTTTAKKAEKKESDTHILTSCEAKKPKIIWKKTIWKKNYFLRTENNETNKKTLREWLQLLSM